MSFENLEAGQNFPDDFNMIVEVPTNSAPVKYEVDWKSGTVCVERFMAATMHYPCNCGYVPGTLAANGEALGVLMLAPLDLITGVVVRCRPIGLLAMEDERGEGAKVLALPVVEICSEFESLHDLKDLAPGITDRIAHFFSHYKDLDVGKFARVQEWRGIDAARHALLLGRQRYNSQAPEAGK